MKVIKKGYSNRTNKDIFSAIKYIEYDYKTGDIKRIDRKNSNGSIDKYGYLIIKIKGKQWKAHRLGWTYYYKENPSKNIDHINRNKTDNRIENLRVVEQKINVLNTKRGKNNKTNYIGIYYDDVTKGLLAKYTTRINKKTYRFRNIEDAIKLRINNKLEI